MADLAQLYASLFGAGLSGDNPDLLAQQGQSQGLDTTLADAQTFLQNRQMIPSPSAAGAGGPSSTTDPASVGGATGGIGGEFPKGSGSGGANPQTNQPPTGPTPTGTGGVNWGGMAFGAAPGLLSSGLSAAGSAGMLGSDIASLGAGGLGLGLAPFTSMIPVSDIMSALGSAWFGIGSDAQKREMDKHSTESQLQAGLANMMGTNEWGDRGPGMPLNAATTPDEIYRILMGNPTGQRNALPFLSGFPGSENPMTQPDYSDASAPPEFSQWLQNPEAMNLSVRSIPNSFGSSYQAPDMSGTNTNLTSSARQQAQMINLLMSLSGAAAPGDLAQPVADLQRRHATEMESSAARRARQQAAQEQAWYQQYASNPLGGI